MGVSKDLLNKFAKITKTEAPKTEAIYYGTIAESGGTKYVIIDGSEVLTPISTTVDMIAGERVTVMIKNHTAVVTGNISSPAARTADVKTIISGIPSGVMKLKDGELTLGDLNNEEVLYNILIGLTGVYIRSGSANLAKFANDILELASTDTDVNIYGRAINYYIGTAKANFKPYYEAGDTIEISKWRGCGYTSNSSKYVNFTIPLSKPVLGNPTIAIDWTDGGLLVRQNGEYAFGSSSTKLAIPASYTATLDGDGSFVVIVATFSSSSDHNLYTCGIQAALKITFS